MYLIINTPTQNNAYFVILYNSKDIHCKHNPMVLCGRKMGMYELKRLNKTICLQTGELARLRTPLPPNFSPHTSEEWGVIGVEPNMKRGVVR